MNTLTTSDEQKLIESVKLAVALVEDDKMSPTAAVEKISRDEQFGPGYVRLMSHAYNTGRQTAQREANGGILDKLAGFDLADADAVIRSIYPQEPVTPKEASLRSSVSDDYNQPPRFLEDRDRAKLAAAPLNYESQELEKYASDPMLPINAAYANHSKQAAEAERLRGKHAEAKDKLYGKLSELRTYFKQAAMDRVPFHVAEDAAVTYFGPSAKSLLNYVHTSSGSRDKRAADLPPPTQEVQLDKAPFTLIRDCLDLAKETSAADRAHVQAVKVAGKVREDQISPFSPAASRKQAEVSTYLIPDTAPRAAKSASEKEALLGAVAAGTALAGTKSLLDRALTPKTKKELVDDQWLELESPDHESEMRGIRVRAWLNSVMSDPENPISGFDPDEVMSAYNELAQLAPRAAEQPAVMQPLLSRRLEGKVEPFEAKEIADLEKSIRDTKAPTPTQGLLTSAPDSILG
jgi:hypothetical protein